MSALLSVTILLHGTVEVGKLADLVLIGADPNEDVSSLASVETVVVGGEVVFSRD